MKEKLLFLFFCMIFVGKIAFTQNNIYFIPRFVENKNNELLNKKSVFQNSTLIPSDFYVKQLGFVCKKEWSFEKTTKIPLRIRIGSLSYCNWLEGKKGSSLIQ